MKIRTQKRSSRVRPGVAGRGAAAAATLLLTMALNPSAAAAAGAAVGGSTAAGAAAGGSSTASDPGAPGRHRVASLDYTLGHRAFQVPGFHMSSNGDEDPETLPLADLELTGNVHYPAGLRNGPYPLVVLSHGYWATCSDHAASDAADRALAILRSSTDEEELARADEEYLAAISKLWRWPCADGTPALPSYRGFDYLARRLASHGMVVVSISANGVNAGQIGDRADLARAALINKHLAMWSELTRTGRGPLAGRLVDPRTHAPKAVDFTGHIDLSRVGTVGHSRGGRGVAWHAADVHSGDLPPGVRIAGVVSLAPAGPGNANEPDSPDAPRYRVTSAPLAVWMGSCDYDTGTQGEGYIELAAPVTTAPIYRWHVDGANHSFLNTQWSPSSGQATAGDDFADSLPAGIERPGPGLCGDLSYETDPPSWTSVVRQLTEDEQRRVATGYLTAFFLRTLAGVDRFEPVISGQRHPYASLTKVDASRIDPVG